MQDENSKHATCARIHVYIKFKSSKYGSHVERVILKFNLNAMNRSDKRTGAQNDKQ